MSSESETSYEVSMKFCRKCQMLKPGCAYNKDQRDATGLATHCRACTAISRRLYRQTPQGKAATARAQAKYRATEKGKATLARVQKRYLQSDKGKATRKRNSPPIELDSTTMTSTEKTDGD